MGIFTILNSLINNIQANNDTTKGNSNSTEKAKLENITIFPTSQYSSKTSTLSENDEKDAISYLNSAQDEIEQSEINFFDYSIALTDEKKDDEVKNSPDTKETTQQITYSQEYALLNDKYNLNIDFSKGITEEQFELIEQAYFLEQQQKNLQETQENMLDYFETLGEMDKLCDGLKDLAGLGLTKDDIEWYYNDEKAKNDLLTTIIQNGGSIPLDNNTRELIAQYADEGYDCINEIDEISFDLVYEIIKGVKYNPELISSVMASQDSYAIVAQEQQDAVEFELAMAGSTPEQALEYFNKIAENSEGKITGEELFNNYYKEMFEKYPDKMSFNDRYGIGCNGIEIKDGYLYQELTFPEKYSSDDIELLAQSEFLYKEVDDEGNEKYYRAVSLENENQVKSNAFGEDGEYNITGLMGINTYEYLYRANDAIRDNNLYLDKTKQEYNEQFGKKEDGTIENVFDTILEEYPKMYEEAFGQNTLYNKLTEYERDMDSYSGKLSQTLSIACFAASFIPGVHIAASLPLFAAALDNTIDLVNLATNKKDGEIGTWAGNTLLEAGMMAIGMGINRFASNSANKFVQDKIAKGCQFVLNHANGTEALVEYAIDNAASVVWDLGKGLLDGSLVNEDGSFNISALKQMIVSDLIFNTADLRNGMALYKALNAGNAVDIGNGVKFQIDDSTGNVKYIYENGTEVNISKGKGVLYDSATNKTYDLAYDKSTGSWMLEGNTDSSNAIIRRGSAELTQNVQTGYSKPSDVSVYRFNPNGSVDEVLANNPNVSYDDQAGKYYVQTSWGEKSYIDTGKEYLIATYGEGDYNAIDGSIANKTYVDGESFHADGTRKYVDTASLEYGESVVLTKQAPVEFIFAKAGTQYESLEGVHELQEDSVIMIDADGNPYQNTIDKLFSRNEIDGMSEAEARAEYAKAQAESSSYGQGTKIDLKTGELEVIDNYKKNENYNKLISNLDNVKQDDPASCAAASTINAIEGKPILIQSLLNKFDIDSEGNCKVELFGEEYEFKLDDNTNPLQKTYEMYQANHLGETGGDFTLKVMSELYSDASDILVRPNGDNIDKLKSYSNDDNTILTFNTNKATGDVEANHSYKVVSVDDEGNITLQDPITLKEHTLTKAQYEDADCQIAGKTYTDNGLTDGSEMMLTEGIFKKFTAQLFGKEPRKTENFEQVPIGQNIGLGENAQGGIRSKGYEIDPNSKLQLGIKSELDLSIPEIQEKLSVLEEGDKLTIGRGLSNDINTDDYNGNLSVSEKHVTIEKVNGKYIIYDEGSSYGTIIAGKGQSAPKQQTQVSGLFSSEEWAQFADEQDLKRFPTEEEAKIVGYNGDGFYNYGWHFKLRVYEKTYHKIAHYIVGGPTYEEGGRGGTYSTEEYAKYADELGIYREYPTPREVNVPEEYVREHDWLKDLKEKEAKIAEERLSENKPKTQPAPKQQTSSDGPYSTEEYAQYADELGISRYPTEKEAKIASNDTETEIKFDSKTKSWQTTGSEKTTATAFSDTESAVKSANTRIDNVALDSNASPILIKAPEGFESKYYKMMQDSEFVERLNEYDYNERQRMLTFYKESDLRKAGLITIDEDPTGGLGEFRYSSNEILNPKYVEKIDKLHNAFITGNYEEAYCPKFNSVDNALDNIKTGDVFQVEGDDYISIKLSDGNAEQLHISADTYFKLFNPADELSISQGQNGDCYFISGVDALYNEPTTRAAVLRSFEEIGSGVINVKLRCEDGSILVNTYDSTDITPFLTKNNDVAIGPKGLQMLEDAQGYARMAESSEYQDLTLDEIDSMYESKKESLGLDEADKFLRIVNRIAGKEYDFENNPIESAVEIREAGGMTETAMRFGLKCDRYGLDGDIQVKDVISWLKTSNESDWKNIVFSAGSVGTSDEYLINRKNGIVGQHAYQILPFKTVDGEVKVQVINPHDTRYAKIISLEDFEKDFKRIDLTSGS